MIETIIATMSTKSHKQLLFFILLLAVLLRIPYLNGSFWLDEAAQALEIIRPLSHQLDIVADFQPPLLHYLLHFAQYISHSEWFLRTIGALIPGLITIYVTFRLAEKMFSTKVAVLSTLLLATSSFHIFFSQELRPYSLPTMFATLSMYLFILFSESSKSKTLLLLTVVNCLGLYSSYLYPFFMLAQISFVLLERNKKTLQKYILSFTASIAGFLPLLPLFLQQLSQGGMVRTQLPGWDQVVSTPQLKALPLVIGKLIYGVLPLDPTPFVLFTAAILLCLSLYLLALEIETKAVLITRSAKLLVVWLIVPLLTAWLISFMVPVVSPKRVLFLLPALYILIAYLATSFKKLLSAAVSKAFFLVILTINLVSTAAYYEQPALQREDWKALHQEIIQNYPREKTLLVYSFNTQFAPIEWYESFQTTQYPYLLTGSLSVDTVSDLAETLKKVVEYDTVLVFDYLRTLTDPTNKVDAQLHSFGFKEVGALDYPNIGLVRIFVKPEKIIGSR